ncbi:MAG: diguanylate cyclase (GGDEF)-like protein/PAS domain S-box-containing protein [Marinobacter psychrophilus]|jgi:diguanylate cyclase (GGDEF)-like protein/PAS domain S-box-containing protein
MDMSPQKHADSEKKRLQKTESIQPQGVLLALDSQLFIQCCSENIDELLQLPYTAVLGRNFDEFTNTADIEQIRSLKGLSDWRSCGLLNLRIRQGDNWLNCNAAVSYDNHRWLVELELQAQDQDQNALFGQLFIPTRALLWQLNREQDLHSYTHKVAELVRQVTGYDRVMMYQFDHNSDGEVIAESRSAQMNSCLGNRFPASDISAQTQALSSQNLTWVTANRKCATVPVHGAPDIDTDQPLDMTYSAYRSLPLVDLEYLGNLGVAAALTISLTQNGRLWGLLMCHHNTPKNVTLRERELYEFIGRTISIKLPDLQRNEQPLLQPEQDFRRLAELSNDMTVRLQGDGTISYVSSIVKTLLGHTVESLQGTPFTLLLNDEGVDAFERGQRALEEAGVTQKITLKFRHTDRHSVWVEATMWQPESSAGPGQGVVLSAHDVSQRKKYQRLIEELNQHNSLQQQDQDGNDQQPVTSQTFLDQTSEAVVIAGADGRIQSVNRSFCEITGYTSQEAIGHNPSILQSGIHTAHFYESLWRSLSEKGRWKGEIWNSRKNGEVYPQLGSISVIRNNDGSIRNYVAVFSDVSKAKEAENNLFFAQNHDPLTGLPNRQYCLDKVRHVIAERAQAVPGVAVVFLDIDRFKLLNDARGHHTGDSFLQAVAQRLTEACPRNGLLCRWGADEFVLVLEQVTNRDGIAVIVQTLFNALAKPLKLAGHELIPSACVGISFYPEDAADAQGLMQAAETALYLAKERGPSSIELFTPLLAERLQRKFEVASELRRAIRNDELTLNYQPQVDCKTAGLLGVEALVRWQHPVNGLMSPVTFIPLAEELGLIGLLGDWVLEKAMAQMARWRDQGHPVPQVAVNIAPQQLVPGFADHIRDLLAKHQLPASMLELEITEGALERDDRIIKLLQALRDMGVLLAIDDFGTGYSSLAHIKHLPVTCLKIDKVFIDDLPHDAYDVAIIRTVLALGHSLGFRVLAEGVETEEQFLFLVEQGIDTIQGYYFGKPMEAIALEQWIIDRDKG